MVVKIPKKLEMKSLLPAPCSPLPAHVLAFPRSYAMVPETQRQPSSSTSLPVRLPQVVPLSQYFLLMDINGILLATHFGIIGKEKVKSMHTRVRDGLREFLVHCTSNFNVVF
jgi:hypothetical protein